MNNHYNKKILVGGVVATLVMLPGCMVMDYFKGKPTNQASTTMTEPMSQASSPVLSGETIATMNGNAIITTGTLQAEKDTIVKNNPQIKAALAIMDPAVLDKNLTDGLVSQIVVDEEVSSRGLDKSAEYQSELADAYKAIKRMLNAKYFGQTLNVAVTDAQAKEFYETNKNTIPGLLISQGGTVASGLRFENEEDAREFLTRVKANNNDFRKVAQQEDLTNAITDFKMVNAQSLGIDPMLRDKIVAMKTVPGVELINTGDAVWVVNATSKEQAKYRPFEQIKDNIKQELEKQKRGELFEVEINKLKDKYNVQINEDYFKSPEMPGDMNEEVEVRGSATAEVDSFKEKQVA